MKVYKFRRTDQLEFALDILLNRRLYCTRAEATNDILEGLWGYVEHPGGEPYFSESRRREISRQVRAMRFCSLSRTYDSHLMWAHYASAFRGLCIEMDWPEADARVLQEVHYGGVFRMLNSQDHPTPAEAAEVVLLEKLRDWGYEQEVRLLSGEEFVPLPAGCPLKLILGGMMPDAMKRALVIVCRDQGIPVRVTGIGDEGIDLDPYHDGTSPSALIGPENLGGAEGVARSEDARELGG